MPDTPHPKPPGGAERDAGAILPTPLRLGADERFRGRGVTIAFIDAGFYPHPDLVEPRTRILRFVDVTDRRASYPRLLRPDESSWHGMMTSVVACGNGTLSGGLYRGLASEANVVLVKVGTARRITHENLRRGLEWVVKNRERYGIRVCNVSCGGDYEASYLFDDLSQSAEKATRAGILVVAAAGNLGLVPGHPVLPPASAPSVLTVGGLDDKNRLHRAGHDIYHGSWGPTVDGLQKPEVIAPAIWLAAPILPGTPTAAEASLYTHLATARDDELDVVLEAHEGVDAALDAARHLAPPLIRQLVEAKLSDNNVISGAYKHVDGTSFAAPIVSSLAAQMVEANPALRPHELKSILVTTANRLPHVPVDRQGWGVVEPAAAVEEALARAGDGPAA
ncbi:MAG: S8 family serine peptidase [Thermoanaerobaculia bacterium]|nr:S8 family serine peptidase [Thermoanaerobaculia bacterium]